MILIQGGASATGRAPRARKRAEPDLTAIGEIAAGIAHDMNNRLAVILGQTQLLRRTATLDPAIDRKLEKVEHEALRASTMTRGLLDRARREPQHEPLAINMLVVRALDLAHAKRGSHAIDIDLDLSDQEPVIVGDAEQLTQAVVHLVSNALDAMPGSGTLTVRTRITDDTLDLVIVDTGVGMDPEQVTRIFEPFYTTKAEGRGAGVGLFLTTQILKAHGGTITVDTAPGRGTAMRVRLPRAHSAAPRLVVVK